MSDEPLPVMGGASDVQPPGYYRFRAQRGAPWQAVRIIEADGRVFVLLSGVMVQGSGAVHLHDIPFVHPPGALGARQFHPVTEAEYLALLAAIEAAPDGTPLATPNQRADLRHTRSLW